MKYFFDHLVLFANIQSKCRLVQSDLPWQRQTCLRGAHSDCRTFRRQPENIEVATTWKHYRTPQSDNSQTPDPSDQCLDALASLAVRFFHQTWGYPRPSPNTSSWFSSSDLAPTKAYTTRSLPIPTYEHCIPLNPIFPPLHHPQAQLHPHLSFKTETPRPLPGTGPTESLVNDRP